MSVLITVLDFLEGLYDALNPYISKWEHYVEEANLARSIMDADDGSPPVVQLSYTLARFDKMTYQPREPIRRGYHPGS